MPSTTDDNKLALWDVIEANYWQSVEAVRAREDRETEKLLSVKTEPIQVELIRLYHERRELEIRLETLNQLCRESETRLTGLTEEDEARQQTVSKQRALDDEEKRALFKDYRQSHLADEDSDRQDAVDERDVRPAADMTRSSSLSSILGEVPTPEFNDYLASEQSHDPAAQRPQDQTGTAVEQPSSSQQTSSASDERTARVRAKSQEVTKQTASDMDWVVSESDSAEDQGKGEDDDDDDGGDGDYEQRARRRTSRRKSRPSRAALEHAQEKIRQSQERRASKLQTPDEADDQDDISDLPEITKETLELRDDGVVFTDPPCMRNVPLVKISPNHAYWEPDWVPLEDQIRCQLYAWVEKHAELMEDSSASQPRRWLAQRQINRGRAMLQFLEKGDLHPYQIIGKGFITKSLIIYDTLYRMVQVLDELKKFKLDIEPSQWLRQRLHEIHVEKGDGFDLAHTVSRMYHDPKVIALRLKNGFRNIGRQAGYKMKGKTASTGGTPSKQTPKGVKRKELHPTPTGTPQKEQARAGHGHSARSSARKNRHDSAEATSSQQRASNNTTADTHHPKKQKLDQQPRQSDSSHSRTAESAVDRQPLEEDLEYSGYTSTDSFSGDRIVRVDWRIHQAKTCFSTTNPEVTQYWHWVEKAPPELGESYIFEHQVLKDVVDREASWGVYKDPYDFHLRRSELVSVSYAPDNLKVVVATKEVPGVAYRGDVLGQFKRERTKKRFLSFMRKKGVKLVRVDANFVEQAWEKMQSSILPGSDSES